MDFNKEMTLNDMIKGLSAVVIPLLIWGVSVETRVTKNQIETDLNTKKVDLLQLKLDESFSLIIENHFEVMNQFHYLDLKLEKKEDVKSSVKIDNYETSKH